MGNRAFYKKKHRLKHLIAAALPTIL